MASRVQLWLTRSLARGLMTRRRLRTIDRLIRRTAALTFGAGSLEAGAQATQASPETPEVPIGHAVILDVPRKVIKPTFTLTKRMQVTIEAHVVPGGIDPWLWMRQPDGQSYDARQTRFDGGAILTTHVLDPGTYRFDLEAENFEAAANRTVRVIVAPYIELGKGSILGDFADGPGRSREGYVSFSALPQQQISVGARAPAEVAMGLTSLTLIGEGGLELKTVRASEPLEWKAGPNPFQIASYLVRVSRTASAPDGPYMVTANVQGVSMSTDSLAPDGRPWVVLDSASAPRQPPAQAAPPPTAAPAGGPPAAARGLALADLALGQVFDGQFDPDRARVRENAATQYYGITCESGARLLIDVTSEWDNTALLVDAHESLLTTSADGVGTNARLFYECADAARYFVGVQGGLAVPRPFSILARRLDGGSGEEAGTIASGQSRRADPRASGGRFRGNPVQYYGFACDYSQRVSFRASGVPPVARLLVLDPTGSLARTGQSTLDIVCGRRGMWVVGVNAPGPVTLFMDPPAPVHGPSPQAEPPRATDREPARPEPPRRVRLDYGIQVTTADESGAGTDANVFIDISGSLGKSGPIRLNALVSGNAFEAGSVDDVVLQGILDLGEIYSISVWHDDAHAGSSWKLSTIRLSVSGGQAYFFECRCWLQGSNNRTLVRPRG